MDLRNFASDGALPLPNVSKIIPFNPFFSAMAEMIDGCIPGNIFINAILLSKPLLTENLPSGFFLIAL